MDIEHLLATRTSKMGASAIREILKVVSQPGMVSLAGGIPAQESFPMAILADLTSIVFEKYGSRAFQYDATEGFMPLREALVPYLAGRGITARADEIFISSGSQGVLDAVGKVFISKNDKVAVEAPSYLGALQAFNPYEPQYVEIMTDDDGLIPESLQDVLKNNEIKLVYLVPTFQNPTGRTIPLERRKKIASLAIQYNVLLIEDDPYACLRYRGSDIPTIRSLAPDNTIYIGSLSKIFAPGLRLGFFVAPGIVPRWLVIAKQGIDLHTSTFNQALAAEYLAGGYVSEHLPKIIGLYKPRQEAMLQSLEDFFPSSYRWSKPDGGMFIWVEGPTGGKIDMVYRKSIENNVAFVPGQFFYAHEGEGLNTMRLNYTMYDEGVISESIKKVGRIIRELEG